MNLKKSLRTFLINNAFYLWVIFLFCVVTAFFDMRVAVFELIIFLGLAVFYFVTIIFRKRDVLHYLNKLTYTIDSAHKDSLFNFPMPVVILTDNGTIAWYNEFFANIANIDFAKSDAFERKISSVIPNFDFDSLYKEGDSLVSYYFKLGEKYYHVFGNITHIENSNDSCVVLYWDDRTEDELLKIKYDEEKFVSAVMVIDNYDDILQDTPPADRPILIATFDEALTSLADEVNGILKKQEKDRYFFYFDNKTLKHFIDTKFEFLKDLREIRMGNKFPLTLSIGIGCDGKDMAQNDAFSYVALDMALGRGGDQVVIKDKEKYSFFGGKSKEIEKRTRVKSRIVSYALKELIEEAENVVIMGHRHADVDVMGAALGLFRACSALDKEVKLLMQTYNQSVKNLIDLLGDEYDEFIINEAYASEIITKKTLIIVVDTHMKGLLEAPQFLERTTRIVVIDHHRRSADFIDNAVLTYHEPYASSTSELITEMLQYMDSSIMLKRIEADALYAGIYLDTKNFSFKTGVRTFEAAAYLKKLGVDTVYIKKLFQVDMDTVAKKWRIIESAHLYKDNIVYATCEKSADDMQTIVAQAADELLNVKGVNCSFVICQVGTDVIISARSFGEINVQLVLEKLSGGGHMTMAGANIKNSTVPIVVEQLKNVLDEYLKTK